MSPFIKTKRRANFKDFKRFGAFKQKKRCIQLVRVKKKPNLHKNSSNKLLFLNEASTLLKKKNA
jgi:hypothetical protein